MDFKLCNFFSVFLNEQICFMVYRPNSSELKFYSVTLSYHNYYHLSKIFTSCLVPCDYTITNCLLWPKKDIYNS